MKADCYRVKYLTRQGVAYCVMQFVSCALGFSKQQTSMPIETEVPGQHLVDITVQQGTDVDNIVHPVDTSALGQTRADVRVQQGLIPVGARAITQNRLGNVAQNEITVAEPLGLSATRPAHLPREHEYGMINFDRHRREKKETIWTPFGPVDAIPGIDVPPPFPSDRDLPSDMKRPPLAPSYPSKKKHFKTPIPDDAEIQAPSVSVGERDKSTPKELAVRRRQRRKKREVVEENVMDDSDDADSFDPGAIADRRRRNTLTAMDGISTARRLGRSVYDAVQTHGHFGMVDTGESEGGLRRVIVHVPKSSRGYFLDIHAGDVIHANSGRGKPVGGRLDVQYVTRHQYFAPGRAVTSCVIAVPEEQWRKFEN